MMLTAARTGEAAGAQWSELPTWGDSAERMKGWEEHRSYLCPRAIEILEEMRGVGPVNDYPSVTSHDKPMSNMAMLAVLKRMQRSDITVHGFRSTFSTWANENAIARADVIEACLAHREGDKIRVAQNRAQFATERRPLLEVWAEYRSNPSGSNVVEILKKLTRPA